jgi:hypothetical protein
MLQCYRNSDRGGSREGENVASGDTNKLPLPMLPYEACLGCPYECKSSTCVGITLPEEDYIKSIREGFNHGGKRREH